MRSKPLLAAVGMLLLAAAAGCKPSPDAGRFKRVKEKLSSESENDRAIGAEMAKGVSSPKYIVKLIPVLIERLDPAKEKNPWASLYAASSLAIMTGQEFGSERRSHKRWHKWWFKEARQKLPKRQEPDKKHINQVNAKRLNGQGEFHLAGGNTVKAMDLFRQAISRDGSVALYHSNLGLALLKMGDHDGASQRFDDAIAVDPGFILAYLNKGAVFSDQAQKLRALAARIQRAMKTFDKADDKKRLEAADKELTRTMKLIRTSEEQALDTYRHAVAVDRGDRLWAAHAAMGRVHMQRGNFEKAITPLEKALQLRRNDIGIHRDLALTYYGLDQYYRASKEIKRVEELGGKMDPGFTKKVEAKVKDMEKELDS